MRGDNFFVIREVDGRNSRVGNPTSEQIRAKLPEFSLANLLPHRPRILVLTPPQKYHSSQLTLEVNYDHKMYPTKLQNRKLIEVWVWFVCVESDNGSNCIFLLLEKQLVHLRLLRKSWGLQRYVTVFFFSFFLPLNTVSNTATNVNLARPGLGWILGLTSRPSPVSTCAKRQSNRVN